MMLYLPLPFDNGYALVWLKLPRYCKRAESLYTFLKSMGSTACIRWDCNDLKPRWNI